VRLDGSREILPPVLNGQTPDDDEEVLPGPDPVQGGGTLLPVLPLPDKISL